ncbi:MAG: DUF3298 domain-containing protein [Trueperaceae bacterium]|nr:DUF3298 domain-containing protein [Trueperaceae bacterium]
MNISRQLTSTVMVGVLVLFGAAFAQPEQHSYLVGTIGEDAVQVELIVDNGSVRGSFYDSAGTERTLEGGLGNRAELSVVVLGADQTQLATITGVLEPTRFEGDYTPSGADTSLAVALQTVADYAYLRFDQNMIEASTVFPYFIAGSRGNILNDDWQSRAIDEHLSFVREGQDYMDEMAEGSFVTGYFLDAQHDIVYYASDLISVLETVSVYTGGAHPNLYYNTYNVGLGQDAVPFGLRDVLGESGVAAVRDYVVAELREQEGAVWVQESGTLDDESLSVFVVTPTGLRFHFAPYVVGPYAAGTFEVLVPWGGLEPYIPTDSPFARFL